MLITTVFRDADPEGVCEAKAWAAVRFCVSVACALSFGSLFLIVVLREHSRQKAKIEEKPSRIWLTGFPEFTS